jgi:hypothetical protein
MTDNTFDEIECQVPEHCVTYIVYGDYGDLTDEEIERIDSFLEGVYEKADHIPGWWQFSDEGYFHYRNDIDGNLGGNVIDASYVFPISDD